MARRERKEKMLLCVPFAPFIVGLILTRDLDRSAKPQPELDEVAGGHGTIFVEVEDWAATAEGKAELDKSLAPYFRPSFQ